MNDEFIKEYMLSSYILVLSTKRLRRDLNPCYSTVTEWCHNQLGDGAKTRWIYLQFNIPNITHYLYCCIHLNGGGRTRTYGVSLSRFYAYNGIWTRYNVVSNFGCAVGANVVLNWKDFVLPLSIIALIGINQHSNSLLTAKI